MSWSKLHSESELLSSEADAATRRGDLRRAAQLFADAARAEVKALAALGSDKPRTLGITAVSAVALFYKAGELDEAERLAHQGSAMHALPAFALNELRTLLQAIWNEQAQRVAGVSFIPGQVTVSVKGGEIVFGGAPLDIVVEKVQIIQSLFYRTAEFIKDIPLRKKGPPSKELQASCRPWLFQSVPGSYQFVVAVQKPLQEELFPGDNPDPAMLTDTFLSILRNAGESPDEGLKGVVGRDDYRMTFLKMTRNLAPTGRVIEEIEIRGSGDRKPIILSSGSRKLISESLRGPFEAAPLSIRGPEEDVLRGNLRALDLDHDWLDVSVDGALQRVKGVGEAVDDLIGPMVNRDVLVRVRREARGILSFVDIEQEE